MAAAILYAIQSAHLFCVILIARDFLLTVNCVYAPTLTLYCVASENIHVYR